MPRLFALDQNFPQPLVHAVAPFLRDVELVPIRTIDARLADMEDWEIFLALHHHHRPWDGLVTTDASMINQPRELAVLRQTNLTLVVAHDAGHNLVKATGLLLAHLDYIVRHSTPDEPQIWRLSARSQPAQNVVDLLDRVAAHQNRDPDELWHESRLTNAELARDPLAD